MGEKQYKKYMKQAYKAEKNAFKHWDKGEYSKAAEFFADSAKNFKLASENAENIKDKTLSISNMYVEHSNYNWVLGLKKYSEEKYREALNYFKNAIQNKKAALKADKMDKEVRKREKNVKDEAKRREWIIYQRSTMKELYGYYYLCLGHLYEKAGRLRKAVEFFEHAAINYDKQSVYLRKVGKSGRLAKFYALKTYIKVGECHRRMKNLSQALHYYNKVIEEIKKMGKRYERDAKPIIYLTKGEMGECYLETGEIDKAYPKYVEFLNWARSVKLKEDQAEEVARCLAICVIINIQRDRLRENMKLIDLFGSHGVFGGKSKAVEKSSWYKFAKVLFEYHKTRDYALLEDAKLIYDTAITDGKNKFIENFLSEQLISRKNI